MLKFKVGHLVSYRANSAHSRNAAHGVYEIVRVLRGEQYRIKAQQRPTRGAAPQG
jgi:hypothetical protein